MLLAKMMTSWLLLAFFSHFEPTDMSIFKCNLLVTISMVVLACGSSGHAQTLENPSPTWLLKSAINPLPNWYEVRGGAWRVSEDVVEEMASRIEAEVDSSVRPRLDTYIIQYQGELSGSARSIRLMGACNIGRAGELDFSARFYIVSDGGECFFDAIYDPKGKRFTSLTYHGKA